MRLPILFGLLVSLLTSSLCAQQGRRHDPRPDAPPHRTERTAPEPRGLPQRQPQRGFQQRAPLAPRRAMLMERMRMQMRHRFQAQRFSHPELRQRIAERLRSRQEQVRGGQAPRRAEGLRRPPLRQAAPQQPAPKAPKKRRIV